MKYDYAVYIVFDDAVNKNIQKIKNTLVNNNFPTTEKPWPPHITIDLYNNISLEEVKFLTQKMAKETMPFAFEFDALNTFGNKVLFLQPNQKEKFEQIKQKFNLTFKSYRIDELIKQHQTYSPHATLSIFNDVMPAKQFLESDFQPIKAVANKFAIYRKDMSLVEVFEFEAKKDKHFDAGF